MGIGWILAAMMAVVTIVVVALLLGYHRREVRRLRSSHEDSIRKVSTKHKRRLERLDREHDREMRAAHHPLAQDLLPALDSLDEALAHLDDEDRTLSAEALEEGLQLARNAIYDALARHDIKPIVPDENSPFDPEIHEAISRSEGGDAEPGTIRRLFRRGYRDEFRLLRAALVEVNVAPAQELESSDDEESTSDDEEPSSEDEMADKDDVDTSSDPPSNGCVERE